MERTCKKCDETKSIEEFSKDKSCKYGYSHVCKKCVLERSKKYAKDNPEKIHLKSINYYNKNKDKLQKKAKDYYTKNKNKILSNKKYDENAKIAQLKYKKNNPEKISKIQSKYWINNKSKIKIKAKGRYKKYLLTDGYLIRVIKKDHNLSTEEIKSNPELLILKRIAIENYRIHLKELKNGN
jgi:hypothetical protein